MSAAASAGPPPCLLDVAQAALRLGVPVRFVRRLVAERRVRYVKLGRYVRFDPADLDALIGEGLVHPHPGPSLATPPLHASRRAVQ